MKKRNIATFIAPIVLSLVGVGMLIAGLTAVPGALTDDGYPLDSFFYVMGGFFIVWPLVVFGGIILFRNRSSQKLANLKANGIKGKARVMGMRNTGVRINHVPQVVLDLAITTDYGEKMHASYKKCIEPIYYSILRPDLDLVVYVDATDKQNVFVDLEETWRIMAGGTGEVWTQA